jgi:WD40 repeat protein
MTTFLVEQQREGILICDPTGGGVDAVAFSRDGKLLASAGADGNIRLWDPATEQMVGAPLPADTGTRGGVNGVAFSPDGKRLASPDADGKVRLWNPATGRPVGAPLPADTGAGGGVYGVAFSPDGQAASQRRRRRQRTAVEPGHPTATASSPPR